MPDFRVEIATIDAAYAAALKAPLSRRRAMLVVLLIDAFAEGLFAASGEDDILKFGERLGAQHPDLGLVLGLAAMRPDGPQLVVEAVRVPLESYGALPVEDFMVSLYNEHRVQRLLVALPDGARREAHALLDAAIAALRGSA